MSQIEFTPINNDTNGNSRYVVHFLSLLNDNEHEMYKANLSEKYAYAVKKSHKIGGRKFHNKQYGGGIVFQSYSLPELEKEILQLKNS